MATRVIWKPEQFNIKLFKEVDRREKRLADKYAQAVRANAPVKTGALRNSIGVMRDSLMKWRVFSSSRYAWFVEFGTSKMPARPFFRSALRSVRGALR